MAKTVMSRLSKIREGYARKSSLRRELTYLTDGERSDIEAALSRYGAEANPETLEVRRVLAATQRNLISLGR
jgi:hypothetical protein